MDKYNFIVSIVRVDPEDGKKTEIDFEFSSLDAALHFMQLALTHNRNVCVEIRNFV